MLMTCQYFFMPNCPAAGATLFFYRICVGWKAQVPMIRFNAQPAIHNHADEISGKPRPRPPRVPRTPAE